jgi:two-component system LytT family response regulator
VTGALRALIVDDEPRGRQCVRILLDADAEVETVGEAADGTAALEAVAALRPDLLFLDVQMPGMDGFDLLRLLPGEPGPVVVFSTAYEQHALRAFEAHAVEYLVKPYTDARFARALAHAKRIARDRRRAADTASAREPPLGRFAVKALGRVVLVPVEETDLILAAGDYVRIFSGGRRYLLRASIGELQRRLDPARFIRVHRTCLVNLGRVIGFPLTRSGALMVALPGGITRRVSRQGRAELRRVLRQRI